LAAVLRKGFETIAIRPPLIWGKGMPMLDQMAETVKQATGSGWMGVTKRCQPVTWIIL
jgi:hypothetical protein